MRANINGNMESDMKGKGVFVGGLEESAPAKINLYLHVTGRREDGYHFLDSLVVFVGARDIVRYVQGAEPLHLKVTGCFGDRLNQLTVGEDNLVVSTMRYFSELTGIALPKFALKQYDRIPLTRGLGSSAACIVAGLMAANELTGNTVSREDLMNISVECEGHPDNVAPAFKGGMVVGASEGKRFEYVKIDVSDKLEFLALIPDFLLSTADARAVLPRAYTKEQSVFNCS